MLQWVYIAIALFVQLADVVYLKQHCRIRIDWWVGSAIARMWRTSHSQVGQIRIAPVAYLPQTTAVMHLASDCHTVSLARWLIAETEPAPRPGCINQLSPSVRNLASEVVHWCLSAICILAITNPNQPRYTYCSNRATQQADMPHVLRFS